MRSTVVVVGLLTLGANHVNAFWRLPCDKLTLERIDPLVSPGGVASHVHTVMGGSGFGPSVSFDGMRKSNCTSCYVREDMSAYWTPNLYMQFANGSFVAVPQVGGLLAYYLQRGGPGLKAFPDGFRMIAGNPALRSYNRTLEQRAISYNCLSYSTGKNYPETPYIPAQDCPDGLRAQVFFPSCWNGQVDSANHMTHVAYPDGMDNGKCPPTHPQRLISLFYEVIFDVHSLNAYRSLGMNATQPFVLSNGDATGYGWHGDFLNGWDNKVLQTAVDTCTADSGVIEECKAFTFFPKNAVCHKTPDVNEVVTGKILSRLPGCNPVTSGPANAQSCKDPSPPSLIPNAVAYSTKVPPRGAPVVDGTPRILDSGSGYVYTSCYGDGSPRTLTTSLTNAATSANGFSPSACLAACAKGGYKYCGLEYGRECWADNYLASNGKTAVDDGNCGMTCTGDAARLCGDASLLSLYTNPSWKPPLATNPGPAGSKSLGCYTDSSARTLTVRKSATTIATCVSACSGYAYAGMSYGGECFCDNAFQNGGAPATPVDDPFRAGCNMPCSGNATEACGGSWRLNVYALPKATKVQKSVKGGKGRRHLEGIL